ncbi:hypothetical protein OG799_13445 [Micromonospora sp. NBC_00898]|nr:hypothetical protein OG799_13445 [Micromonospora sp. NBC_00898]
MFCRSWEPHDRSDQNKAGVVDPEALAEGTFWHAYIWTLVDDFHRD